MPLRPRLLALAALLAAAGSGVAAQPAMASTSTGTVTGHVVTTDGSPAVDVPIVLDSTIVPEYPEDVVDNSHAHRYVVTTDASGDWTADVQQARYRIDVAPSAVWTDQDQRPYTTVGAGSTTAPQLTAVRLATIRGTIAASEDASGIGGAAIGAYSHTSPYLVGSNDGNVLSVADGGFTLRVPPGAVDLTIDAAGRFEATRTTTVAEGADLDLGTIDLAPSGYVDARIVGRSGRSIVDTAKSVLVDGCRVALGAVVDCPGVTGIPTALQLTPGTHTLRYEAKGLGSVVRHTTKTVTVVANDTTTLAPIVFRADPATVAKVWTGTYRRGHAVTVRVDGAEYTDGTHPHLRPTFLVNGHAVTPTSVAWRALKAGARKILVATLPASWSTRGTLSVQAVFHGTTDYSGSTTAAATLTRR